MSDRPYWPDEDYYPGVRVMVRTVAMNGKLGIITKIDKRGRRAQVRFDKGQGTKRRGSEYHFTSLVPDPDAVTQLAFVLENT